ncbi:MAG: methyl-accepting chemotaxis protein [Spirochaetales bacterium]|nr:methyl-accepting chemotaxis protein [Spirochaetales bacterium]
MKLYHKFIITQLVVLIILMCGFGVFMYLSTLAESEKELETLSQKICDRLAAGLALPLWDYKTETINALIDIEMLDENVSAVTLIQESSVSGKMKNPNGDIIDYRGGETFETIKKNAYIKLSSDIVKEGSTLGVVNLYVSDNAMRGKLFNPIISMLVQLIVLFLLISVSSYGIMRLFINKPLSRVHYRMSEITQGEGDLTQTIDITSKDEVGRLSDVFNLFVNKLRSIVVSIKSSSRKALGIKQHLGSSAEETTAAITEINANIKSIKNQIDELNNKISDTTAGINDITENINSLNMLIQNQANAVNQSSASINQMVSSLNNVANITTLKKNSTMRLSETVMQGGEQLSEMTYVISEINKNIDSISEMVDLIDNIASQTNLLSMNAAIEAAHAGESGKGFSVVADEIRKLAETSRTQANEIGKLLETMVEKILQAGDASVKTNTAFSEIENEVKDVTQAFDEISLTTAEMSSGGQEVMKAMNVLNDISHNVKDSSSRIRESTDGIKTNIDTLERISIEVVSGMDDIMKGTGNVLGAMEEVRELSMKLGSATDSLNHEVNKFAT